MVQKQKLSHKNLTPELPFDVAYAAAPHMKVASGMWHEESGIGIHTAWLLD